MPDFTARISAGVTPTVWDDHEGAGVSRINPSPAHAQKYLRAAVGVTVTIFAKLPSTIEAPPDATLGGRLFTSDFVEYASASAPVVTSPGGFSSIQSFVPGTVGHYLWFIRRPDGGGIGFHLDVE
jgi:hypothetical protein